MEALSGQFPDRHKQGTTVILPNPVEVLSTKLPFRLFSFAERHQSNLTVRRQELNMKQWLTIDAHYATFHAARKHLPDTKKENVRQCLNFPDVQEACKETLQLVIAHLTSAYPDYFSCTNGHVKNHITGESFLVTTDCPLEVAARLAKEDFNVLLKKRGETEHRLVASATLFPAGWVLQERIGWKLTELHKAVPDWQKKLGVATERAFSRIGKRKNGDTPGHNIEDEKSVFERLAYFFQIVDPKASLADALYVPCPEQLIPESLIARYTHQEIIENMIIRRERQTFRRLSKVNGVLFSVNTFVVLVTDLSTDELQALVKEVIGWSEEAGSYKGRDLWVKYLLEYVEQRLSK